MLVSYRWLRELLPELKADPREVAERLTAVGLTVDGLSSFGVALASVLVAKVERVEPHPSRSGLRLVTVDRGGQAQQVVCGAANVPPPGGLVVLATLGTHLSAVGMTLEPRTIAGVTSEGMLCSERELGLADEADGILILPPGTASPGTPLHVALPEASDTIFEVDVTPNRPDALGHLGVARDLAAALGLPFAAAEPPAPARVSETPLAEVVSATVRDADRCPRYSVGAVLGVEIGPSPLWLRWRLASLGVRPISNVVDVTNLVLLERSQPMHAFDRRQLGGARIEVRRAAAGEAFTTLDGVERSLDADDLVIADEAGPTALAGVMGGLHSEIQPDTRDVVLECAYFEPRAIRRTARRHGLHTESSHRFERGVDWCGLEPALERAKGLLAELAGGAAIPGALHCGPESLATPTIRLRSARLAALLGLSVSVERMVDVLGSLGFSVSSQRGGELEVKGASHRPDVSREVDLIEEVARIVGLDAIPTALPAIPPQEPRTVARFERRACQVAENLGLSEALTYAFVAPRDLERLSAPAACVHIDNPLSEDRTVLRTTLLPGLLEALRRARRHGQAAVRLFSVAPLFLPPPAGDRVELRAGRPRLEGDVGALPEERLAFAAILAGPRPAYLSRTEDVDVFDAKGVAVELVERLTGRAATVRHADGNAGFEHLHPLCAAALFVDDQRVGSFGTLHPGVVDAFDLEGAAQVVEIDLAGVEALGHRLPRYRPLAKLPAITRDLALELPQGVAAGAVEALVRDSAGELCESVELFDVFEGGSLPPGVRSLAFRVVYRDPRAASAPECARTLTDKEVDACQKRVLEAAVQQLGASLRG